MKTLFFDIETIPTEQFLLEHRLLETEIQVDHIEVIKRLSLSGATAKIVCLAYALEPPPDAPVELLQGEETHILESFWRLATDTNLFVGHNIFDFDLRFIWQRSIVHGIRPPREIPLERFTSSPVFDTMQEWSKWGPGHVSLDVLARALGIPSPKECLDGSRVYPYYRAGRLTEICEYCKCDVETVRQVYRRLIFAAPAGS